MECILKKVIRSINVINVNLGKLTSRKINSHVLFFLKVKKAASDMPISSITAAIVHMRDDAVRGVL